MILHPKTRENGGRVRIESPHIPSDPTTWADAASVATFVPGGKCPESLHGVAFTPWRDHPTTVSGWNAVAGQMPGLKELPMPRVEGKHEAAGVVAVEVDGRVWTVSPTNRYGGYENTFPKGTLAVGINPQASAIKEALEESGLRVEITGFLVDVQRSTSVTRYYSARRVGGTPTDAGWESQAVHLVPLAALPAHAANKNDAAIIAALNRTG